MSYPLISAGPEATLTLDDGGERREVALYSDEGRELLSALWLKQSFQFRAMYEPTWLGVPIIQLPTDVLMMQELIWKLRPDVIVETGVAHGGSAIFYASLLELIGKGRVIAVDVEIRQHNRRVIEAHPMSKRITLIEGSSIDPETLEQVHGGIQPTDSVLVTLDSNHEAAHVAQELELYAPLVAPGGYMVAMDGVRAILGDVPRTQEPTWTEDNPIPAIEAFVERNDDWEIDPHYTRLPDTCSPLGFLRRKAET